MGGREAMTRAARSREAWALGPLPWHWGVPRERHFTRWTHAPAKGQEQSPWGPGEPGRHVGCAQAREGVGGQAELGSKSLWGLLPVQECAGAPASLCQGRGGV